LTVAASAQEIYIEGDVQKVADTFHGYAEEKEGLKQDLAAAFEEWTEATHDNRDLVKSGIENIEDVFESFGEVAYLASHDGDKEDLLEEFDQIQ